MISPISSVTVARTDSSVTSVVGTSVVMIVLSVVLVWRWPTLRGAWILNRLARVGMADGGANDGVAIPARRRRPAPTLWVANCERELGLVPGLVLGVGQGLNLEGAGTPVQACTDSLGDRL